MSNQKDTQREKQGTRLWLWRVILVAITPILGYALAYMYEGAFCEVFEIPQVFIIVSWTSIFIATLSIQGVLLALFGVMALVSSLAPRIRERNIIIKTLATNMMVVTAFLIIPILFPSFWPHFILIYLPIMVFLFLLLFIVPLIGMKNVAGYRNKLDYQDGKVAAFSDKIVQRIGLPVISIAIVIIFLLLASYASGYDEAKSQEEFLIPSTHQPLVVLRLYGDNLICAPLDREKREIERTFYILPMSDIYLTPENVGPLTISSRIDE